LSNSQPHNEENELEIIAVGPSVKFIL